MRGEVNSSSSPVPESNRVFSFYGTRVKIYHVTVGCQFVCS